MKTPDGRFKAFNQMHLRGPDHEYGSTRLADASIGAQEYTRKRFTDVLRQLADMIEASDDPYDMADAYAFLRNAHQMLPAIRAWCVVKHYAHHEPGDPWTPKVWLACIEKEQAEALATAIEAHYRNRSKHRKTHDTFTVEHRKARAIDFLHPDCTVERFLRGLR